MSVVLGCCPSLSFAPFYNVEILSGTPGSRIFLSLGTRLVNSAFHAVSEFASRGSTVRYGLFFSARPAYVFSDPPIDLLL